MSKITTLPPKDIQFGHELLPYFPLASGYKMTNSGAHGVPPNYVLEARKNYYQEIEENPDLLYRTKHENYYDKRKEMAAKLFNTDRLDIGIVENVTEGLNSILKSIQYKAGDILLIYDTAFLVVKEICRYLEEKYKCQFVVIQTTPQALNSSQELVNLAEEKNQAIWE
jgi:selenocysteine lyase/cysteine desulfurase